MARLYIFYLCTNGISHISKISLTNFLSRGPKWLSEREICVIIREKTCFFCSDICFKVA